MKNLVILLAFIMTIGCFDDSETPAPAPSIIDVPITEQEGIMLKAIKESPNYYFKDNKVIYSIDSNGIEQQFIIDKDDNDLELVDFFRKDGKSYFKIKTYIEIDNPDYDPELLPEDEGYQPEKLTNIKYLGYKQVDGNVTKIDTLPEKPTIERTTYLSQTFSITTNSYNGQTVSDVRNEKLETGIARFFLVDGAAAYVAEVGMYFHVKNGLYEGETVVYTPGLYFWPENRTSISKIMDTGVMW